MYIPRLFEEKSVPVIHELMRSHPFAAVVAMRSDGLVATHIPLVLDAEDSEFGTLRGHMARANSHWREADRSVDALVIFSGVEHYISPSWYPANQDKLPTWNYTVVHAYGPMSVHEDPGWLLAHLNSLVNQHEGASERAWKVSDARQEYIQGQMKAIVGIEIPIRRLEGKWKVSQNRSESERRGVSEGLAELNTPESLAMKALVDRR